MNTFPSPMEILEKYLDGINEADNIVRSKRPIGKFSASSAGKCFKQVYYQSLQAERKPFEFRVKALLRDGTLFHSDMEKANTHYDWPEQMLVMIEKDISIEKLSVLGRLDLALLNLKTGKVKVTDYKTVNSYKWRLKFGLKKNRDKSPSKMYELQVGTYALGIAEEHDIRYEDFELELLWKNKDTSAMKEEEIDWAFIRMAELYWEDLNEALEDITSPEDLIPYETFGVPMEHWECKYCAYLEQCKPITKPYLGEKK